MTDLTIRAATPADWPTVAEMAARTFVPPEIKREAERYWHHLSRGPGFDWELVRLGLVDGQIVAHVGVLERVLRVGPAALRFGGVFGVMTHPDFRRQGIADRLMRDALRVMRERGLHLSLLDGVPRYYDRFGYVTTWPSYEMKLSAWDLRRVPDDGAGYEVRPYRPDDLPTLLGMYDAEWGPRPFRHARTPEWMGWRLGFRLEDGRPMVDVVVDPQGAIRGYSAGWRPIVRAEIITLDRAAVVALMRHAAGQLGDAPDDTIVYWRDVPDSRTARCVADITTVRYDALRSLHGGWMARLVDAAAACQALRPALVERASKAGLPHPGDVFLTVAANGGAQDGVQDVVLHTGSAMLRLPSTQFLPLLFGLLLPADIDDLPAASVSAADRALLKRLFPPVVNGLAGLDWF